VSGLLAGRARRTRSVDQLILAGAALLLAVAVFGTDFGRFATDTRPDLYLAPGQALRDALSAWVPEPYLGSPNYQPGLTPVALLTAGLAAVGLPAWLIMRMVRFGLLLLAGWGARLLYRELARERPTRSTPRTRGSRGAGGVAAAGPVGGIVVAVAYVANPFVVVLGSALPLLLPHAVLPWLVLVLRRALSGRFPWRYAAAFAVAFFAMGGENAGVDLAAES